MGAVSYQVLDDGGQTITLDDEGAIIALTLLIDFSVPTAGNGN